jgi:hypothetical protein
MSPEITKSNPTQNKLMVGQEHARTKKENETNQLIRESKNIEVRGKRMKRKEVIIKSDLDLKMMKKKIQRRMETQMLLEANTKSGAKSKMKA